jgi:hypothetical protein
MIGQPRPQLSSEAVSQLDQLAMRMKNEIGQAAGKEGIDLCYRILISLIADTVGPKVDDVSRTLRSSTDAVILFLERIPGGEIKRIPQH